MSRPPLLTLTSDQAAELSRAMRHVPHYTVERSVSGREFKVFVYDGTNRYSSAWNSFYPSERLAHRRARKMLRKALARVERAAVFDANGEALNPTPKRMRAVS